MQNATQFLPLVVCLFLSPIGGCDDSSSWLDEPTASEKATPKNSKFRVLMEESEPELLASLEAAGTMNAPLMDFLETLTSPPPAPSPPEVSVSSFQRVIFATASYEVESLGAVDANFEYDMATESMRTSIVSPEGDVIFMSDDLSFTSEDEVLSPSLPEDQFQSLAQATSAAMSSPQFLDQFRQEVEEVTSMGCEFGCQTAGLAGGAVGGQLGVQACKVASAATGLWGTFLGHVGCKRLRGPVGSLTGWLTANICKKAFCRRQQFPSMFEKPRL